MKWWKVMVLLIKRTINLLLCKNREQAVIHKTIKLKSLKNMNIYLITTFKRFNRLKKL